MDSVALSRTFDAPPEAVREAIDDLGPFMQAAGFDDVTVDGETFRIVNRVGLVSIELTLDLVGDPDLALAYEQREGIFEEMRTTYAVTSTPDGSEMTARTEFALDVALVGEILDSTVIKRQRRKELSAQFDWLDEVVASGEYSG